MPDQMELSFFIVGIVLTAFFSWALVRFWKHSRAEETKILRQERERLERQTPVSPRPVSEKTDHISSAEPERTSAAESQAAVDSAASATGTTAPATTLRSLGDALSGTHKWLWGRIKSSLLESGTDQELDRIEEILYTSDLGSSTVELIMTRLKKDLTSAELKIDEKVRGVLKNQFLEIFGPEAVEPMGVHRPLSTEPRAPKVWMIVGVNGAGKTTSIGKLSALMAKQGQKVLVAAGDTFRAAAGHQLKEWTDRAQVDIYSPAHVSDPSAVGFEALSKAVKENYDLLIVDTAGRLHTQAPLMEELKKMKKVLAKVQPSAPDETLIVLDANSGQNALQQAHEFHKALGLTGIILTKMDGTAKGGVALGIANELKIPIRMIGVGEKLEDLRPFSPEAYVDSIIQA